MTAKVVAQLAALRSAPAAALKSQWRQLFETEPPPYNRRFLESRLAYRIQELAYGGLSAETLERLRAMGRQYDAKGAGKRKVLVTDRRPIAGTRLIRQWDGIEHCVTVRQDDFEYLGKPVNKQVLYRLLNNRVYLGEAVHKGTSYPGEHAPLIGQELWDQVQQILKVSPRKRAGAARAQTPALLRGLLFGADGAAMSPTHTRKGGRLYRYYISQSALKGIAGPDLLRQVPAEPVERIVVDQIRALLRAPEIIVQVWRIARTTIKDLSETDVRASLVEFDGVWNELFPQEQARIVQLLVDRVEVDSTGVNVRLRLDGLGSLAAELQTSKREAA